MKQGLSKEHAVAAADALLSREPMFGDSRIGRLLKRWGLRRVPRSMWDQESIRPMPKPTGFESPGSAEWGVMHPHTPFE